MTTITGQKLREAEAATATLDGGNSTAAQRIAAILKVIHPNVSFDKEANSMLGLDLEEQERSRHKGFRNQVSDIEPRPQVALEFTVPSLPPAVAVAMVEDGAASTESEDAQIARAKAEAGNQTMTGQSDRLTGPAADLTPNSPKPKAPKLSDPATGKAG
jgi:hypothetical protein